MKLIQYPVKDTYITNKIVNNSQRKTEANVGLASTLDIFKLYDINKISTETEPYVEISRGLIQFDLATLKNEIEKHCSIDESSLTIKLVLKDLQGSQTAPENFVLELWPVKSSWTEGFGSDIYEFSENGAASWVSASLTNAWESEGGDITGSMIQSQTFVNGHEDLEMDITDYCISAMKNNDPNYGWMLKLADSHEDDDQNYFVKRFLTKQSADYFLRPKLEVSFNNHFLQHRQLFYTDLENTIAIEYYGRNGERQSLNTLPSCSLSYGDWSLDGTVEAVSIAGIEQPGWYQASFRAIDIHTTDILLKTDLEANLELGLTETWTIGSGSIFSGEVNLLLKQANSSNGPQDWRFTPYDIRKEYPFGEIARLRIFARDKKRTNEPVRTPIQLPSLIIEKCYYQIREEHSKRIIVPWSYGVDDSTRISNDSFGMYFQLDTGVLQKGKTYTIEILYIENGQVKTDNLNTAFRIK